MSCKSNKNLNGFSQTINFIWLDIVDFQVSMRNKIYLNKVSLET